MLPDDLKSHIEKLLAEIDEELKRERVPIPRRSMHVIFKYQDRLGMRLVFPSEETNFISGWFKKKYGNVRQEVPLGFSVVLISGHVFKIKLPIIYGRPNINPLTFIDGATSELWTAQSSVEVDRITRVTIGVIQRFQLLANYLDAVGGDLAASTTHLLGHAADYGLSKWASLMMVEKLTKKILTQKKIDFKKTHNIRDHLLLISSAGVLEIPEILLKRVEASPSIRYDKNTKLNDALSAHYASFDICAQITDPKNQYKLRGEFLEPV